MAVPLPAERAGAAALRRRASALGCASLVFLLAFAPSAMAAANGPAAKSAGGEGAAGMILLLEIVILIVLGRLLGEFKTDADLRREFLAAVAAPRETFG